MFTQTIFAAGALLSVVAAVPMHQHHHHNKRDMVWVTNTEVTVTTIPVTQTVWLEPGETPPAESYENHRHRPTITSHIKSTVTVPAGPPSSAESSPESTYVAPSPSSYEAPSSTSVYVAPTSSSVYVAPSSSSVYVAPTPSSVYVAPTTAAALTSAASVSSSLASPSASPSSGSGSGGSYSGDGTYYTPGMGSCGKTNTGTDMIVAMAEDVMTKAAADAGVANPNDNPLCGKQITISYGGKTQTATITDTCPGCSGDSLDMTPSLFQIFADLSVGRLYDVEWSYV